MSLKVKLATVLGTVIVAVIFIFIAMTFYINQEIDNPAAKELDSQRYWYLNGDKIETIVSPPENIPFYLKLMIWIADKKANKKMLTGRLLAWSARLGIGSGLLEMLIEDGAARCLEPRLIKLLRMQVSFLVPSAFAIDINSENYPNFQITDEEIEGLQGLKELESIGSFSLKEKLALIYARQLSNTPIILDTSLRKEIRLEFNPKEIVGIAALVAKVNYWTRLIEALGVQPAGFSEGYHVLHLERYRTVKAYSEK